MVTNASFMRQSKVIIREMHIANPVITGSAAQIMKKQRRPIAHGYNKSILEEQDESIHL